MAVITSCNTSTLQPYVPSATNPWNEERVRHVYRRLGYDAKNWLAVTQSMIDLSAVPDQQQQLVDYLAKPENCLRYG